MKTQRVTAYRAEHDKPVFQIEQYNPELKEWFIIGGTYDKYEHAQTQVENHNLKELLKLLDR